MRASYLGLLLFISGTYGQQLPGVGQGSFGNPTGSLPGAGQGNFGNIGAGTLPGAGQGSFGNPSISLPGGGGGANAGSFGSPTGPGGSSGGSAPAISSNSNGGQTPGGGLLGALGGGLTQGNGLLGALGGGSLGGQSPGNGLLGALGGAGSGSSRNPMQQAGGLLGALGGGTSGAPLTSQANPLSSLGGLGLGNGGTAQQGGSAFSGPGNPLGALGGGSGLGGIGSFGNAQRGMSGIGLSNLGGQNGLGNHLISGLQGMGQAAAGALNPTLNGLPGLSPGILNNPLSALNTPGVGPASLMNLQSGLLGANSGIGLGSPLLGTATPLLSGIGLGAQVKWAKLGINFSLLPVTTQQQLMLLVGSYGAMMSIPGQQQLILNMVGLTTLQKQRLMMLSATGRLRRSFFGMGIPLNFVVGMKRLNVKMIMLKNQIRRLSFKIRRVRRAEMFEKSRLMSGIGGAPPYVPGPGGEMGYGQYPQMEVQESHNLRTWVGHRPILKANGSLLMVQVPKKTVLQVKVLKVWMVQNLLDQILKKWINKALDPDSKVDLEKEWIQVLVRGKTIPLKICVEQGHKELVKAHQMKWVHLVKDSTALLKLGDRYHKE
jgi:hypothetical protein